MFDLRAVGDWIEGNVFFVLFVIAAASVAVGAINQKARAAMLTFSLAMLALLLVVVARNYNSIINWFQGFFTA
ncbi:hypothetical protein [Paenarthrobacter sp. NPDC090522]|uniref:hypothetical protein n=1 Tax=Paenarthrobacter sp. NPDC090522 TaxID=3364383 RepID=UPI003819CDF9